MWTRIGRCFAMAAESATTRWIFTAPTSLSRWAILRRPGAMRKRRSLFTGSRLGPRVSRGVEHRIALCEGLAGGGLVAPARARAVIERERQRDVFNTDGMWALLANFYETLGYWDQAMETLREAMRGLVTSSPREIRDDWRWAAAKDDPRFEEILRSAKPL